MVPEKKTTALGSLLGKGRTLVKPSRRFGEAQQAHSMGTMNDLLGFPYFRQLEEESLPRDEVEARYRGLRTPSE